MKLLALIFLSPIGGLICGTCSNADMKCAPGSDLVCKNYKLPTGDKCLCTCQGAK